MMHLNGDADLVGQTLQFAFPQADAIAVGAAAVGGDADLLPPAADRLDREGRRVVGAGEIVNAIGNRRPQFLVQEVVDPHLFRIALATPLPSGVLEVADEPFFLVSTEITA